MSRICRYDDSSVDGERRPHVDCRLSHGRGVANHRQRPSAEEPVENSSAGAERMPKPQRVKAVPRPARLVAELQPHRTHRVSRCEQHDVVACSLACRAWRCRSTSASRDRRRSREGPRIVPTSPYSKKSLNTAGGSSSANVRRHIARRNAWNRATTGRASTCRSHRRSRSITFRVSESAFANFGDFARGLDRGEQSHLPRARARRPGCSACRPSSCTLIAPSRSTIRIVRNGAAQSRVIGRGQVRSISELAVTICPDGGSSTVGSRSGGTTPVHSASPSHPGTGVPPSLPLRIGIRPDIA